MDLSYLCTQRLISESAVKLFLDIIYNVSFGKRLAEVAVTKDAL